MKPFQPPSTPAATGAELKNLHEKLRRFQSVSQLPPSATAGETREKINEIIALLAEVTRAGNVRRT